MRQLLDYDPINGVSCYFNTEEGKAYFTHEQDVSKVLERNREAANDDDKTKHGIKNDWWKYASIPTVVEVEWLQKYGVSLDNPNHKKAIFKLLNSPDYKYLKTTTKFHSG